MTPHRRRLLRIGLSTLLIVVLSLPSAVLAQPAQGARRVALVIGNGAYRNVDRLNNPAHDARLIAQTLRANGFTLVGDGANIDLDKPRFDRLVQGFGRAIQGADVALFYYSGHGMQVNGTNWLVPVDASPTGARDLDFQAVDVSLVLRQMEGSATRLNMIILDACRNNPFASRGIRATAGGLAEMRAPEGTIISYATQPGNVASDGGAANSPYTTALAQAMRMPGLDIFQVFNQVGLTVKQATAGQQQPWLASSPISGNFYFFSGPVTIAPAAPPSDEAVFWQSVADSRRPEDLQAYLARYPNGVFAALARSRLAALGRGAAPATPGTTRFDGSWTAFMRCGATADGALEWSQRLTAVVRGGAVHVEMGVAGAPASLSVDGTIGDDGNGVLLVRGLTGAARYTIAQRPRGTPYSYRMAARFDDRRGEAQRQQGRDCSIVFTRN